MATTLLVAITAFSQAPIKETSPTSITSLMQKLMVGKILYLPKVFTPPSGTPVTLFNSPDSLGAVVFCLQDSMTYTYVGAGVWKITEDNRYALKSTTITAAGNGLVGGGSLAGNRTFSLDFTYLDSRYPLTGSVDSMLGLLVRYTDTASMLAPFVRTYGDQSVGGIKTFNNNIIGDSGIIVGNLNDVRSIREVYALNVFDPSVFGRLNRAYSRYNFAAGAGNYADGFLSGTYGNTNIASGNDSWADGNRNATGRKMFAVDSFGVGNPGLGIGNRAYVVISPSEGDITGYFPNATKDGDTNYIDSTYATGYTISNGFVTNPAVVDSFFRMPPYMIIRSASVETDIILKKIIAANYDPSVGTRIYYDTTDNAYSNISFVYGSYAPIVYVDSSFSGNGQHAEGLFTNTWGYGSHSEGAYTRAWNGYAHAEGFYSKAYGLASHSQGFETIAKSYASHAGGRFNIDNGSSNTWVDTDPLFTLGNGASNSARSNAFQVLKNGNTSISGNLTASSIIKSGGTSSQFLKADGSVDNTSYGVGTVTSVSATGGTGISVTGSPITGSGTLTITNTAPDQTVSLTNGGNITITGAYPNFTLTNGITNNNQLTNGAGYITSSALTPYLLLAGGTMSGSINMGTNSISNVNNFSAINLTGTGTANLPFATVIQAGNAGAGGNYDIFVKAKSNNVVKLRTKAELISDLGLLTGNQTITLSGDVSGSGTTAITTSIGALKVTNGMLAGSIDYAKMNAATVPTWNQNTTGTAANATTWDGWGKDGSLYTTGTLSYVMVYNSTTNKWQPAADYTIKDWLSLGSYAYRSSGLAELSGATFTGGLNGTTANFTNSALGAVLNLDVNVTNRARLRFDVQENYAQIQALGQGASMGSLALNPVGNNVLVGTAIDNGTDALQVAGSVLFTGNVTSGAILSTGVSTFSRGTLVFQINPSFAGGNVYSQLQSTGALALATGGDNNRLYIDATGAATFSSSVTAASFIKSGGTSSQFLMADGSTTTGTGGIVNTAYISGVSSALTMCTYTAGAQNEMVMIYGQVVETSNLGGVSIKADFTDDSNTARTNSFVVGQATNSDLSDARPFYIKAGTTITIKTAIINSPTYNCKVTIQKIN